MFDTKQGQPQGYMHQYFELLVVLKKKKDKNVRAWMSCSPESLEEESEDWGSVLRESLLPFLWENNVSENGGTVANRRED